MKGVRCLGLLIFSITCSLFLSPSLGVSALKHDYEGVPLFTPFVPLSFSQSEENGPYSIDWTNSDRGFSNAYLFSTYTGFHLSAEGDAYLSSYDDINWKNNMSYMDSSLIDNKCNYNNYYSLSGITKGDGTLSVSFGPNFIDNRTKLNSSFPFYCYYHQPFNSGFMPDLNVLSVPSAPLISANDSNGFVRNFQSPYSAYQQAFQPYWYTYDGFYTHSTAIDTESNIHYNHSFSFSDMFTQPIKRFSRLTLPLWSYDDYWTDPSNFWRGRDVRWQGVFDFDQPLTFGTMASNSYFQVVLEGVDQTQQPVQQTIECIFNNRSVADIESYQLEYVCSDTLAYDFIFVFPYLDMYNPGSYIFTTDGDWRWASQFLVTDNDETPGQSFGGLTSGIGDANVDMAEDQPNWFESLINMFNFDFINPFAPIFSLFTDNSACVEIPIIAGMLHSEETTVCPWFPSEVRSIVTPVVGLSAMMLLFGFVVRWLGSSSGNMFEDAGVVEPPSINSANKGWRRGNK